MKLRNFWTGLPRPVRIIASSLPRVIPQMFGITLITFLLIRLLPGDPVLLMLGNTATPASIAALREHLGLDKGIWEQFIIYVGHAIHGDLGISLFTSNPVVTDLIERAPATLELITYAMILIVLIGVTVAVVAVVKKGGITDYISRVYCLAAGAIPDFWVGLLLIFFLFHLAGIAPAPFGRIGTAVPAPHTITGFYTIDSLISGNWVAFKSSVERLALPVLTLVIVYTGMLMKITKVTFADIYRSEFIQHQRACGLSERLIIKSALRNGLPPIITMVGFLFGYLLGAAVLVETIFSWGGLGQYAVQSIVNSDYPALQGFILVASLFILIVYLIVDVLYELVDPRIKV